MLQATLKGFLWYIKVWWNTHFYVCADFVAKMEGIESQAIVTGLSYSKMIVSKVSYVSNGFLADNRTWKIPDMISACGASLSKFKASA